MPSVCPTPFNISNAYPLPASSPRSLQPRGQKEGPKRHLPTAPSSHWGFHIAGAARRGVPMCSALPPTRHHAFCPPHTSFVSLPGVGGTGRQLLIRAPATGPCPCRRPSVGNRRLYTLAAPAADPFVGPRVYPRPSPARIRSTDLYVSCAGCSINVQKHRFLQCFVAFGVHDFRLTGRPVVSVMRAARTGLIDVSWVLGT